MQCADLTISDLGILNSRINDQLNGTRYPLQGSIEVTERCNNGCVHCYINKPVNDKYARHAELNFEEWCTVIDQIVDEGCLWLLMTGGEPFVRPDFLDIYTYAKRKGLLVTIFTNGTTLNQRIVDYLAKWVPYEIEITLYGHTREVYEKVTKQPGSFDRCRRGIELLQQHGLPLALKSMVIKENQHELQAMKNYAEKLGVRFRYDMQVNMGLDGTHQPIDQRLAPEQIVQFEQKDSERSKSWHDFKDAYAGVALDDERLYKCGAGIRLFNIDAYGRLSVCSMQREPGYDLRKGTFRDGWRGVIQDEIGKKRTVSSECQQCELAAICNQCPGWSKLEHGDSETKVDYVCRVTKMRATALNLWDK